MTPALYVICVHGVHVASAMLSGDAVKYCPAGHVVFLTEHDVAPLVPALKCVDAHDVHVASAVLSVEAVKY